MAITDDTIKRAAQGVRESQEEIYRQLNHRIFLLVRRIVGASDADDVTQDVFVSLFKKMHSFQFESSFATWVYRLAVNDALQHLRRSKRRSTVPFDESQVDSGRPLVNTELQELLDVALARLDVELRVILQLKEVEKMSYEEIAKVLGIPEGTVGSRLNRARRELRDHLTQLGWEG